MKDVCTCHSNQLFYAKIELDFPVIVNSNTTVVKAEADAGKLNLKIVNAKGEQVDLIQMKK